jgi:pyridoxine 5-phosphate synthase
MQKLRLGINIDHVATVRNARGGEHPDPIMAAKIAEKAGADGITAHLREDRRHIRDDDIFRIKEEIGLPLNFEMAATEEMLQIALKVKPHACCLVPEKRAEVTTEGGLDVISGQQYLTIFTRKLKDAGIRVSLFIDPDSAQVEAAKEIGADIVELHTGSYSHASGDKQIKQLQRIINAAQAAEKIGIECHAGHGLNFDNVQGVAEIKNIVELNIGHFLIGEAIFIGLEAAIKKMRALMDAARKREAT